MLLCGALGVGFGAQEHQAQRAQQGDEREQRHVQWAEQTRP